MIDWGTYGLSNCLDILGGGHHDMPDNGPRSSIPTVIIEIWV